MKQLILVSVLLMVAPLSATATNYYVNNTNGSASDSNAGTDPSLPWLTIGKCASKIAAGDTCTVFAGTYNEHVSVSAGAVGAYKTFQVNGTDVVTVQSFTLGSHTKLIGNCPSAPSAIGTCGFSITDPSSPGTTCVSAGSSTDVYVANNTMTECGGITMSSSASFIYVQGNTVSWLCRTPSSGTACDGIAVHGNHILVEQNDISHYRLGVNYQGTYGVFRNNTFHDQYETDSGQHTDAFFSEPVTEPSQYHVIEGNTHNNAVGLNAKGMLSQGDACSGNCYNVIIRYNTEEHIDGEIIVDENGGNSTKPGFYNVKSYNNTFVDVGRLDLTDFGVTDYFANNSINPSDLNDIFYYTGAVPGLNPYSTDPSTAPFTVGHNLAFCAVSPCILHAHVYNSGTFTDDPGNLRADPAFVNYAGNDFHLRAVSPAIGAGTNLTTVSNSDTGSGTSLIVHDASYFQDGYGLSGVQADWIRIGAATTVQITAVNYSTNTLTLANSVPRASGNAVYLYKKSDGVVVLNGSAPDMGAFPSAAPTPGNSGTITTSSVGISSLTLNWTKATDNTTAQSALQYEVVLSTSNNIDSVMNAAANGTIIQAYTADIAAFNVTGLASGTTYFFNVIVIDQAGFTAAYVMKSETTTGFSVAPATLPYGGIGIPYSQSITASGGTAPYTFSLAGTLPAGLSLNASTGLLSGTPISTGSTNFTVQVVDSAGINGARPYTLTIASNESNNIVLVLNDCAPASCWDGTSGTSTTGTLIDGTYTINATITNNGPSLTNPVFFQVIQLSKVGTDLKPTEPDILETADDVGGNIQSLGFSNGLPSASPVQVQFLIGVGSRQNFTFIVGLFAYLPQIRKADAKIVELKPDAAGEIAPRLLKTLTLHGPDSVSSAPPSFSSVGVITEPGSRSRSAVAVDPHLSRRMAVAANDTSGNVIVSTTEDGGSTWHSTTMSRSIGGADFFNAQDPSVAFDSKGKLSVVYVLSNMYDPANAIVLAESIDGVNFSPPSTITFHNAEDNVIDSRPVIAIGSRGRYVAWENFGSRINVARSGEDGIFDSPVTVVSGAQVSAPSIAIGGQTVYIGWDEWGFNSRPPYHTGGRVMTAASPDAAQLVFSTPRLIATTNIGFSSSRIPMLPAPRGVSTNLHLAVHPNNENLLYAVFVDKQDSLAVRFAWSFDRGMSWDGVTLNNTGSGGDQFSPAMLIDGHGGVHVSFYDTLQKQATTAQVFLASSSTTYSFPPQRHFNLYREQRPPAETFVYQQITTLPIDESKANLGGGIVTNLGDRTAIAGSSENILIAWTDTREKKEDVYVSILPICGTSER